MATLLVSGCAPPMPSIWRGSGEPMMRQQQRVPRGRIGRQVVGEEIGALGGAAPEDHARNARLNGPSPLSW